MSGLEYAAMYRVEDENAHTREIFSEAKLRWVADVIALDCRPTGDADPVMSLTEVGGKPWVQISAPVRRTPESTWPEGRHFKSNPAPRKAA